MWYSASENGELQQQPQRYSFDDYVKIWEANHQKKMSADQRKVLESGCIGITSLELGNNRDMKTGAPKNTLAFSSFGLAQAEAQKLKKDIQEHPEKYPENARVVIYSVRFRTKNESLYLPDKSGKVDMSSWSASEASRTP
jgi:hypothetical protein